MNKDTRPTDVELRLISTLLIAYGFENLDVEAAMKTITVKMPSESYEVFFILKRHGMPSEISISTSDSSELRFLQDGTDISFHLVDSPKENVVSIMLSACSGGCPIPPIRMPDNIEICMKGTFTSFL